MSSRTSQNLLSVPILLDEQHVPAACHSAAHTGKASSHSEDKLPSCHRRSKLHMRTYFCLMPLATLNHHFNDNGSTTLELHLCQMTLNQNSTHRLHMTCPTV